MTNTDDDRARQEIIELLPFHAAGTLEPNEAARVEAALAHDPELARHYDLAREELVETIGLNESLGAPSARVAQRLFAAIEADARPTRAAKLRGTTAGPPRLVAWLVGLSPRTLAWSAAAAVLAIVLQAGVIATMLAGSHGGSFETASYRGQSEATGPTVLIRFAPQATAAEIAAFLEANRASIAAGPMAGGLFRLTVTPQAGQDLAAIVGRMQQSPVAGFVAPGG